MACQSGDATVLVVKIVLMKMVLGGISVRVYLNQKDDVVGQPYLKRSGQKPFCSLFYAFEVKEHTRPACLWLRGGWSSCVR